MLRTLYSVNVLLNTLWNYVPYNELIIFNHLVNGTVARLRYQSGVTQRCSQHPATGRRQRHADTVLPTCVACDACVDRVPDRNN